MAGERAADQRGRGARGLSSGGLDAELDRAVGSVEPIAYVIVFVGDQPGRVYPLNRDIALLGRVDEADIHIVDASVSAQHAQIVSGSHGFEIEDLGSTNGTFVGGQRVRSAPLRNGDRVTVGSVELLFMVDRPVDATIALLPPARRPMVPMPTAMSMSTSASASVVSRRARDAGDDDEEGPSLADTIRRFANIYRYVRKRAPLIAVLGGVGGLIGLVSIIPLPAGSAAVCEVKLLPQVKSNPVEPQRPSFEEVDSPQFFQGAERAFGQREIVRATLRKLRSTDGRRGEKQEDPTDAELAAVGARLKLEPLGEHLFRASYQDQRFHRESWPLEEFLAVHVQNYVQSEINKSLREFSAKAAFLRDQMKVVEKDLAVVNDQKTRFREANSESLPEEAAQTHMSRFQLRSHQTEVLAQIRRLEGELEADRQQLVAETPLAQAKLQSSQTYRDSLADINRKLTEAYARGLADGHPEVQRLNSEKERIKELINHEVAATSSSFDRQSNANYQALKNRVDTLQAQLRAARTDLSETLRSLGQLREVVGELPRVEQRLSDLDREQAVTTRLHSQLFEKLKQAELQLNLEHVSAESRYEISPPRLERPGTRLTLALRFGIGLMAGLFVAAAVISVGEGRRLVAEALATPHDRPSHSRT